MENLNLVTIIDQTFEGMIKKNVGSVIVDSFQNIEEITLSSGKVLHAKFAEISLLRLNSNNVVKLRYNDDKNDAKIFLFKSTEDKHLILKCLRDNDIHPVPEKFLEARDSMNLVQQTMVEYMFN